MTKYSDKIIQVPIEKCVFDDLQPRQEGRFQDLEDLAEDLKARGQIEPCLGVKNNGHFDMVNGERRTRAAKLAGWTSIAMRLAEFDSPLEQYEAQMASNLKRLETKPIEMAFAMRRYCKQWATEGREGDPIIALMKITGFKRKYFEDCGCILEAPAAMQQAILDGKVGDYSPSEIFHAVPGKDKDSKAVQEGVSEAYIEAQQFRQKKQEVRRAEAEERAKAAAKAAAERAIKQGKPPPPPAAPKPQTAKPIAKGLGANTVRVLRDPLRNIAKDPTLKPVQKKHAAKQVVLRATGVLNGDKVVRKGDFIAYREKFRGWLDVVKQMPVKGFTQNEINVLAAGLNNIVILFREKCRMIGMTPRCPIPGTKKPTP